MTLLERNAMLDRYKGTYSVSRSVATVVKVLQKVEGRMPSTAAAIGILLSVAFTSPAMAGPFGLSMGMSLAEVKSIDPAMTELAPGKYKLTRVPKPHSAFESYVVQICPKLGLSWIKGVGTDVTTSSFGYELQAAFDKLSEKLDKAYGAGETTNMLLPGSIWREPSDFMMGLVKKERLWVRIWSNDTGAKLDSTLSKIGITASPLSTHKGYLIVEYYFSNSEACDKEIAAKEDDNL